MVGMPNGVSFISEMEQIIIQLERGTLITRFFPRKKPERKMLMIRRETRQIVWCRSSSAKEFEGAVDMREVKEIRQGKNSKDFERWPDENKKTEAGKCFVVFYGQEFRVKSLSVAGKLKLLKLIQFKANQAMINIHFSSVRKGVRIVAERFKTFSSRYNKISLSSTSREVVKKRILHNGE